MNQALIGWCQRSHLVSIDHDCKTVSPHLLAWPNLHGFFDNFNGLALRLNDLIGFEGRPQKMQTYRMGQHGGVYLSIGFIQGSILIVVLRAYVYGYPR